MTRIGQHHQRELGLPACSAVGSWPLCRPPARSVSGIRTRQPRCIWAPRGAAGDGYGQNENRKQPRRGCSPRRRSASALPAAALKQNNISSVPSPRAPSSPLPPPTSLQNLVHWCDSSPCKNGGKCWQVNNHYRCECSSGWTGLYCDIPNVSCEVAARRQGGSCFLLGVLTSMLEVCVCVWGGLWVSVQVERRRFWATRFEVWLAAIPLSPPSGQVARGQRKE